MNAVTTKRRQYRFGIALLLVMISYTVFCFAPRDRLGVLVIFLVYGVTLGFVLRTSDLHPNALRLTTPIAVLLMLMGLATLAGDPRTFRGLGGLIATLLLVATVGAVSRGAAQQARTEARISVSTVIGVVTIYLLIGLIYSTAFGALAMLHGAGFFNGVEGDPTGVDLVYYSVVTMATVGYGDITPLTNAGRLTAISAALIGQLYLVTVVAVVVSNIGRRPRAEAAEPPSSTV